MEQAVSLLGRRMGIPDPSCDRNQWEGIHNRLSASVMLTEEGWDLYFSSYDRVSMISLCEGSSRFQMKILLGLAKKSNKWSRPYFKPRITLLF